MAGNGKQARKTRARKQRQAEERRQHYVSWRDGTHQGRMARNVGVAPSLYRELQRHGRI